MILYLVLIVGCLLLGGTALWISGYLSRRPITAPSAEPVAASLPPVTSPEPPENQHRISELETLVESLIEDRKNFENLSRQAVEDKVAADEEIARMSVELGQLEGDKGRKEDEIERLKQELDGFKQRPRPKLPQPTPVSASTQTESDEIDSLTASLDLERVAHQKTRQELELLKKSPVVTPPAPERRAFPTMAFAAPRQSLTGSEDDAMQKSLDKIQAEKDEIEAELVKTRQELQFLKMRSSS